MSLRGNRCSRCKCIGHNIQRCFITSEEANNRKICYFTAVREGINSINNFDNHYLALRLSDIRNNTSMSGVVIRSERNVHSVRAIRLALQRERDDAHAEQRRFNEARREEAAMTEAQARDTQQTQIQTQQTQIQTQLHAQQTRIQALARTLTLARARASRPSPQMNKVQELLFDNADKIPEGLYLELMNALVSR